MDFERIAFSGLFAVCVVATLTGIGCVVESLRADGRVDYCRIIYDNDSAIHLPVYRVVGHRNWRPDINVAVASTAEEAATSRYVA